MKTDITLSFKELFAYAEWFNQQLIAYAKKYDRQTDSYFRAKAILTRMINQAYTDKYFRYRFYLWLKGQTSTTQLRELAALVDYDYWNHLTDANAIEYLDSVSCFTGKYQLTTK